MTSTERVRAWVLLSALVLAACGGGGGTSDGGDDLPDIRRPPVPGEHWTISVVDGADVGRQVRLAVDPSGAPAIAYYATSSTQGDPCIGIGSEGQFEARWRVSYATLAAGAWSTETVAEIPIVTSPPGLDLAFAPDGTPTIAALTGAPYERFCGANDLGIYRRAGGSWSVSAAVAESGEAATGEPDSDFGSVVGYWPGLAIASDGTVAVAYKDVHAGSIQRDDLLSTDLEITVGGGGGWSHDVVSPRSGAGDWVRATYDLEDRIVVVYYLPYDRPDNAQKGVYAARSGDGGASWDIVRLVAGSSVEGPDVAVGPTDGVLRVAYYDVTLGQARVATLVDDSAFTALSDGWDVETVGDSRYDEGYELALAVDGSNRVMLAYYRCVRANQTLGACTEADDALVFAYSDAGGWSTEVVDDGEAGSCGHWPGLGVDGDGRPVIAYACQGPEGTGVIDRVLFARRDAL